MEILKIKDWFSDLAIVTRILGEQETQSFMAHLNRLKSLNSIEKILIYSTSKIGINKLFGVLVVYAPTFRRKLIISVDDRKADGEFLYYFG